MYFVVVKRRVAELFVTSLACLFAMGGLVFVLRESCLNIAVVGAKNGSVFCC